ncbi:hypothetical protein EVG20_g6048 [Dentipellis fragilis]|uniref:Uncharacterized protein n=1 Tax=Dentipellis fragilis TaxID=205917 RepID=A0A4Y9YR21_9AGAM|nr:hypothetical protein EVG20_g6048 [Dentipellis fragilis]
MSTQNPHMGYDHTWFEEGAGRRTRDSPSVLRDPIRFSFKRTSFFVARLEAYWGSFDVCAPAGVWQLYSSNAMDQKTNLTSCL